MAEHIVLEPPDPQEEPSCHAYYGILREFIQPDTQTTMNDALARILESMPYSSDHEVGNLVDTFCEVVEQVPYYHASQTRLVTLMDLVLTSEKVYKSTGHPVSAVMAPEELCCGKLANPCATLADRPLQTVWYDGPDNGRLLEMYVPMS